MWRFFKRHWLGVSMTVVALVVASAMVAWFVLPMGDEPESTNHDIGAGVTVIGDMPKDLKAVEVDQTLPLNEEYVDSLSSMVDVGPSGPLDQPVTLQFTLDKPIPEEDRDGVYIATWDEQGDPDDLENWEFLEPEISSDGKYATVETDHLSWWWPFSIDFDTLLEDAGQEVLDTFSGGLTEHAEHPECENEDSARQDGYSIDSSAKETLYWCFGVEDDHRVLKITNRMSYPLTVDHPGLEVKEQALVQLELQQLARIGSGDQSLLLPYETIVYTVDIQPNESVEISTELSEGAQWLHQAEGVVRMVSAMGGMLGGKTIPAWTVLGLLLEEADCYNAYTTGDMGKFITGCLHLETLLNLVGPAGLVLSGFIVTGTFIDWMLDKVRARNSANGDQDEYQVWVTREEQSGCISEDEFAQLFIEQYSLYDAINSPDVVIDGEVVCDNEWTAARVWTTYPGALDMGESTPTLMHWEGNQWELTHGGDGQSNAAVNTDCQDISPNSPVYELMECALRLSE